jgi:spermidine/putrescine transport system permease protein
MNTASKSCKRSGVPTIFSIFPGAIWLGVFMVAPLMVIIVISFCTRGDYGQVEHQFTIENYKRVAGYGTFGFDSVYPFILLRSVWLGVCTVTLTAVASLPLAFAISKLPGKLRLLGLVMVVIPFWSNLLVRTFAWQMLLAPGSYLSHFAQSLHLITPGTGLYPGSLAIYLCMVCDYLPFMILPVYASVEKLDWSLAEAATDLGARGWQVFRHALLPQIRPGLLAGSALVFLPATGQFLIPDLLGGAKTVMLGNLLQQQFGQSRDWPFGSAITTLALLLLGAFLLLLRLVQGNRKFECE